MKRRIVQILGVHGYPQFISEQFQQHYQKLLFVPSENPLHLQNQLTLCIFQNYHQFQLLKNSIRILEHSQIPHYVIGIACPPVDDTQEQEVNISFQQYLQFNVILIDSFSLQFCELEEINQDKPIDLAELKDFKNSQKCCIIS
ncbi:unnamed protein product [Paramecium octaurelia]|uniref:Uncharacterized protein n=1 Tax=Paramecium octaurelia TaxID=43137 RepID=A0A8S1TIN4_PAROT|nr:unnamed protein product [Paramecium octaurelia]